MKSDNFRAGIHKAQNVIDDKFVKRFQKKRSSAQRRSVQLFALLMADRFFNDLDAEVRSFWIDVIIRIFQIFEKAFHSLNPFFVGDDLPASDSFGVSQDILPVLPVNLFQCLPVQRQVR